MLKVHLKMEKNPSSCPFHILMTPFPDISFINKERMGAINESAVRTIIAPKNPPSCFFISCFAVSVGPSVNRSESSSDSTVLIISSILFLPLQLLGHLLFF